MEIRESLTEEERRLINKFFDIPEKTEKENLFQKLTEKNLAGKAKLFEKADLQSVDFNETYSGFKFSK